MTGMTEKLNLKSVRRSYRQNKCILVFPCRTWTILSITYLPSDKEEFRYLSS